MVRIPKEYTPDESKIPEHLSEELKEERRKSIRARKEHEERLKEVSKNLHQALFVEPKKEVAKNV